MPSSRHDCISPRDTSSRFRLRPRLDLARRNGDATRKKPSSNASQLVWLLPHGRLLQPAPLAWSR
ncbi:hypothetical protein OCS_06929 [Ophiocordyceps sinensis CO18]|uniref:Uncharacterized protein n=1 Tax=Ophiocordyceps sinensis (strain Co18 / CGMCC 3.14243) TaxID=911162 RepID=T5A439_OPHSC|nr:hypothetical protein OCS_06929 [Ophiocordyceps sinensis CO18]